MLTIELSKLRFHSFHGFFEEEKQSGAEFELNVLIHFLPGKILVLHLGETVDYVSVYEVITEIMNKPTALLETVVMNMAAELMKKFSLVQEVFVSLTKLHPPVVAFQGSVSVKYTLKRKE